jgi:hypothetical protein
VCVCVERENARARALASKRRAGERERHLEGRGFKGILLRRIGVLDGQALCSNPLSGCRLLVRCGHLGWKV